MRDLTVFSALRAVAVQKRAGSNLTGVYGSRGWFDMTGRPEDWFQRDMHIHPDRMLANPIVFACMTLIAADIGKMRIKLVEQGVDKKAPNIWTEIQSPAFSPVLRKPNAYQTRQQFIERWMLSKLEHGNAYILKARDNRGVVIALYVLDPRCCRPLVSETGDVFYELHEDNLAQVPGPLAIVPASEIIHDRMNCLFHDLVGISPLYAAGLAASQGLKIQEMSATFFSNMSRPGGILTSPGYLAPELALEYKQRWEENYGHGKQGRTAVLGNGLTYAPITQNASDSQLTEQWKMSAELICSTLHVPGYKVGVGAMPVYQNALVLNQIYYDDCLHTHVESIEALYDEGLGLTDQGTRTLGTEFDTDALLRMDESALTEVLTKQVGSALISPNEGRARLNRGPVDGGEDPLIQQQNYSLPALKKRDSLPNPFIVDKPTSNPTPSADGPAPTADPAVGKAVEDLEIIARSLLEAQTAMVFETQGRAELVQRLEVIEKQVETKDSEQIQIEGAKRFAAALLLQIEAEPALG